MGIDGGENLKGIMMTSIVGFLLIILADFNLHAANDSDTFYQKSTVSYVSTFEDPTSRVPSDGISPSLLNDTFYSAVPALHLDWDQPESTTINPWFADSVGGGMLQDEPITQMDYLTYVRTNSSQDYVLTRRSTVSYFKQTSTSTKDKEARQEAVQLL